jgi:hypothetical protein
MTTEIQQADIPPERGTDKGLWAKIAVIGPIVGAAITAVATLATGFWDDGPTVQPSPLGSVENVAKNESGSEVTVTGWAASGVNDVVVLIGPKSSDGQYWVANASVTDQSWGVVVPTDPHVAPGYSVKAFFNRGIMHAVSAKPLNFNDPTPSPAPPANPTDITQCAALYGEACFTDPAWGPPSVYKPNA